MDTPETEQTAMSMSLVRKAIIENDPPVEPGQYWQCYNSDGEVMRRIRILAPDTFTMSHADGDAKREWIYQELSGKMHLNFGRLGICPEFNLRYIYKLVE